MLIETFFVVFISGISLIVLIAYFLDLKLGLVVSAVFSVAFIILCHPSILLVALAVIISNSIPVATTFLKKVISEEHRRLESDLKLSREAYTRLLNEYSTLNDENRNLNRVATEVENLYEVARKMSEALEFDDIFKTFNEFLNRGMKFRECKLLLIEKENDNFYIEKAYRMKHPTISSDNEVQVTPPELKDEIALDIFYQDQRPIFLSSDRDSANLNRFYPKCDIKTFVSNPLFVEDELVGILVLEDLAEKDFEKFLILASQFALEMKKVKLYETIQRLAIVDGLTGVYMRRHFLERVGEEIRRSEFHKLAIAFLMIDIDHFKICNDRYGHLVGDVVLGELAKILKQNVREIDIICRYGGEEFAIVLPDTNKTSASIVAERIRETVEGFTFSAFDEKPQITISVGVSSYPADGSKMEQLIEAADMALYKAKHTGRNKVCIA